MKKSYVKLLVLNILAIITILLSSFVLDKINYSFLTTFMFIMFFIAYFMVGFEKERRENRRTVFFNVIVLTIFYLLFTYVMGIFTSFYNSTYDLSILGIFKNIIYVLPYIVLRELYRYQLISKGSDSKINLVLSSLFFILLSLSTTFKSVDYLDANSVIKYICITFLPTVSKEVMLSYLAYACGYRLTIIYCILTELNVYYMPIFPNFGLYLDAIIRIVYPALVIYIAYMVISKKINKRVLTYKRKRLNYLAYGCFATFFIVVILLISGLVKFQLLTIGSGSMSPYINKGDAIIIEKSNEVFSIDDVIAFKKNNIVIVHRIVEVVENNGKIIYYTKGDNNEREDGYPIYSDDVVGVCRMKIPFIGYPTVWISELFY